MKEEIEAWRKKDPIVSFEGYLEENGLMGREEIIAIRAEVEREVEEAIEFARGSAFSDPCDLDKYVFAQ